MRGNSWEFPLIGKYYFRPRQSGWQPFLGSGWAMRTVGYTFDGNITTLQESPAPPVVTPYHAQSRSDLGIGAVGALGVRLRLAGRMLLAPEFRTTRWGSQQWTNRRNDPAFYLGFHF